MTKRQHYGIGALSVVLFFGAIILGMGIYALTNPPPPDKEISVPGFIAIGSLMVVGPVAWLLLLARNGWRAWAVTASTVDGQPLLYGKGYYSLGMTSGQGVVVCRPGFVAFLPTEPMHHALGDLAGAVAKTVVHNMGVDVHILTFSKKPLVEWIEELRQSNPRGFDATVLKAAEQLKGITWRATEMTVEYDAESSKPKKRMTFRSEKALMMFTRRLDAASQETAGEMCQAIARRVQDASGSAAIFLAE